MQSSNLFFDLAFLMAFSHCLVGISHVIAKECNDESNGDEYAPPTYLPLVTKYVICPKVIVSPSKILNWNAFKAFRCKAKKNI